MKKNLFYAITVIAACFAMVSCEMPSFQNTVEVIGDFVFYKEKVVVKDSTIYIYATDSTDTNPDTVIVEKIDTVLLKGETICIYDTVYVEGGFRVDTVYKTVYDTVFETVFDTVTVTKKLLFDCYGFDRNGNLVATTSEREQALFTYNLSMTTSGDVYFGKEGAEDFILKNSSSRFTNNKASFVVRRGEEEKTLIIFAAGASSVVMNNEEVYPCQDFSVTAELTNLSDKEINGATYQVAVVKYYFYNAQGNVVARAEQYVFGPKAVSKPVNKRVVTIDKNIEGDNLIITGTIDNTLFEDTTVQVRIPLTLSIACGAPQVITGTNFKFNAGKTVSVVSSATVQNKSQETNSLVVSFEEIETVFKHSSTASDTTVVVNPTVRHYDNFVATFGGETEEIDLNDLLVTYIDVTEGEASPTSKKFTLTYKASFAGITSTATQDVTINVNGTSFPGENILFGNKAVSFNQTLGQGVMFTCLVTESTTDGKYYYRYRQEGISTWKRIEIDPAEKTFLENKIKGKDPLKHGLANYWDGKTWIPGTIRCEDFKKEAGYYSYKNGSFGIGQVALETMVDQGYSSAIKPMIHVSGSLYEIDGELYIVK